MGIVRTLLGDVEAGALGITYFHEHMISQPPRHFAGWERDLILDDVDAAVRELESFAAVGGTCIVDATTIDYGRDTAATAEVARRSTVHVVGTSGYNKAAYFTPDIESATLEQLEERLAAEVDVGLDGTPCRAGILKLGTSYYHMTPSEERAARAVCRTQLRSGLPLYTHTEAGTFALDQLDLITAEGVDPGRVCIGHLDRNPDPWYIRQVAARGCYVGLDQVSKVRYATDNARIELIIGLIEHGFGGQILVSGDMARRSYLSAWGGGPGLRYIAATYVPRLVTQLHDAGLSPSKAERVGHDLLVENPLAYLAIEH
jgi:5-phospho-D-xylono-1,4-lactonase